VRDEAQFELEGEDEEDAEGTLFAVEPLRLGLNDELILFDEDTDMKLATANVIQRFGTGANKFKAVYGTVTLKDSSHVGVILKKNVRGVPSSVWHAYLKEFAVVDEHMADVNFVVPPELRAKLA
jgi:hypothetical protein